MDDKLEHYKKQGEEWVQSLCSQPEVPFDEIFDQNDLSASERASYEKHIATIGPFLQLYKISWGTKLLPQSSSKIKWLGRLLVILDSESVVGDKDQFIKKLFSESLRVVCKACEYGFRIGSKSDEHDDILLELKVIALLVKNGFLIDLDATDLPSKKRSEFLVSKNSLIFHVEAKRLNSEILNNTIYGHPAQAGKESFDLNDEQQRAIREQFKKQLKKAVSKFKDYSELYLLVIDIHFPLGFHGDKLVQYLNIYSPDENCLGILMFESDQFKIYRNTDCYVDINEHINLAG